MNQTYRKPASVWRSFAYRTVLVFWVATVSGQQTGELSETAPRSKVTNRPAASLWKPVRELATGGRAQVHWAALDRSALDQEDAALLHLAGVPLRIGVNRPWPTASTRLWEDQVPSEIAGRRVWSYRLNPSGAKAVRLHFTRFELPANGELVIADHAGKVIETFTGAATGDFWSLPIPGSLVHLEYRSALGDASTPGIEIDQISHIYRDPLMPGESPENGGGPQSQGLACQVDVNCAGVPAPVRDAVGRLIYTTGSGTFKCTGTLLADVDANTYAGYLLTANHCINTPAAAASLAVYWFYQTDACNGTVPTLETVPVSSGSTLLATSANTDFTLLRLWDDPNAGQGFVTWTTNNPAVGENLIAVHHPLGEHKRASIGQLTVSEPICGSYPTNRFWYLDWSTGITESGSSGGPLFNSNWQLVGQLFGTCSLNTPGCSNPEDYNVIFGKFGVTYPSIASFLQTITPDDAYEPNDVLAQAPPLLPGTNVLRLVDFEDYFSIALVGGASVTATAEFNPGQLDLDLQLLNAAGSVLDSSSSLTGVETVSNNVPAGTVILRALKTRRWGGDYTLTVVVVVDTNSIPPSISAQPVSLTVTQGQSATLEVAATGAGPLYFQWRKHATNIVGATASMLQLPSAQAVDQGVYSVVVSNHVSSVISSNATLVVNVPPTITQQPVSLTVTQGQSATFTVNASGTGPLQYQWRKNATNLAGATGSSFQVVSAQPIDVGSYSVVVSNVVGSVTSSNAALVVNVAPAITQQPFSLTVTQGQSATFTVNASGTGPLQYQWRKNATNIVGATSSSFQVASAQPIDVGSYSVVVSNVVSSVTSSNATLVVNVGPAITQQPVSLTVTQGQSATFTVNASGTGPLQYQWRKNATNLVGATSSSFQVASAQPIDVGSYSVVVSNVVSSVTSSSATLVVNVPPTITQQPVSLTVTQGQSATFTVNASGTGPLQYQWRKNGTNLVGATSSSFQLVSAQTTNAGTYSVVVSNVVSSVTSSNATLVVNVPPTITQQPVSLMVTQGQSATFTVNATGTGPLQYQWRKDGTNLAGATSSSFQLVSAQTTNAGTYSVVVSNVVSSVTSSNAALVVNVPPAITQQPVSLTVTQGESATFTVNATGTGPLQYQWRKNATNLVGATGSSFQVVSAQPIDVGSYSVVVSNVVSSVTSSNATLVVTVGPAITQQPVSLTVTQGQSATFTVNATGTGPLQYQWRKNATNIAGATSSSFQVASAQPIDVGSYSVVVSNVVSSVTSSNATLVVNVGPAITQQPVSLTVTQGQSATFTVSASGTGPLQYQWRKNGTNLVGATSSSFQVASAQPIYAGTYSVVVSNVVGSVTSSNAALAVNVPPAITQQPLNLTVTQGQSATFTVNASGTGPLQYQWRKNATNIAGATSSSFQVASAQPIDVGSYSVVVSNVVSSVTSSNAALVVTVPPAITQQPVSLTVTQGQSATFTVNASGTGPLQYQWRKDATNIVGATGSSFQVASAQPVDGGIYSVVVSNLLGSVTSSNAALVISLPPVITTHPVGLTVTQGASVTFTVGVTGAVPLQYQWRKNAANIVGATGSSYQLASAQAGDAGTYSVVVSNAAGSAVSSSAVLVVNQSPVPASPQLQRFFGQGLKVPEAILLGSDPDGDAVVLASISPASAGGGMVRMNQGMIFYTPPTGLASADTFTYKIVDQRGGSALGVASIVLITNREAAVSASLTTEPVVRLTGAAEPGSAYTFEFTESLAVPDWQVLGTVLGSPQGELKYLDRPPQDVGVRFYRTTADSGPALPLEIEVASVGVYPVLSGEGIANRGYRIEYSEQLWPPVWRSLGEVLAGGEGRFDYVVDQDVRERTVFYRAITDVVPKVNVVLSPVAPGSYVLLDGNGMPGQKYRVQVAVDLSAPVWQTLGVVPASSLGEFEYLDRPPSNAGMRFYRALPEPELPPDLDVTVVGIPGQPSYQLTGLGSPGGSYKLEFANDLAAPAWQTLTTVIANTSGAFEFTDNPPAGSQMRFYRATPVPTDLAVNVVGIPGQTSYQLMGLGTPGWNYKLEFANALVAPVWQALATVTANPFGTFEFIDQPPVGSQMRFYRATPATVPTPALGVTLVHNGAYRLRFDSIPGITYRVEYTENLASFQWRSLGTSTVNEYGVFEWTDAPPVGAQQRYYRIVHP